MKFVFFFNLRYSENDLPCTIFMLKITNIADIYIHQMISSVSIGSTSDKKTKRQFSKFALLRKAKIFT